MSIRSRAIMTPVVPLRHPARASTVKSTGSGQSTSLPEEVLHIWEHAITLYQGFDWQAAAETFLYLSRVIDRNTEGTLCLLNAAIIFARLGEYGVASGILADAEPDGELTPLLMFVMGHVAFELGDFEKAQECFQISLATMNGSTQRYDHLGLDFTLRSSHIQQDLRTFESKANLFGVLGTLGALPADGLFESPSSLANGVLPSPVGMRTSSDSEYAPTLTDGGTPTTASPVEGFFDNELWHREAHSEHPVTIRKSSFTDDLESIQENGDFSGFSRPQSFVFNRPSEKNSPQVEVVPVASDPLRRERSKRQPNRVRNLSTNHRDSYVSSQRAAFRTGLQPREARVQGNSVNGLAEFILQLPSQNPLKPRPAATSRESTRELADFLRSPEGAAQTAAASIHDDSDGSVYSNDEDERGPNAADKVTDEELFNIAQATPAPTPSRPSLATRSPRYSFRSGVSSMLMGENQSMSDMRNSTWSVSSVSTAAPHTPPNVIVPARASSKKISPLQQLSQPRTSKLTKMTKMTKSTKSQPAAKPAKPSSKSTQSNSAEPGFVQYFGNGRLGRYMSTW